MIIDFILLVNVYFCVLLAQVKQVLKRLFLCTLSIYYSSIIVYYNNCKRDTATARTGTHEATHGRQATSVPGYCLEVSQINNRHRADRIRAHHQSRGANKSTNRKTDEKRR